VADIKIKYPSTSSVALTLALGGLASSSTFIAGRASTAVNNTSNNDTDHILSGKIKGGTTPTVSTEINIYLYANISSSSGTPTYPDSITGTDAAKSMTSANVLASALILAETITVDATTGRDYFFGPISVASFFGGVLPKFWGVYVAHSTVASLDSTDANHVLTYERVLYQTV